MVGAVELVHGGSIRTLLRATGIRNRFWESWDSPAAAPQHCPQGELPHPLLCRWRVLAAHCDRDPHSPGARRTSLASG